SDISIFDMKGNRVPDKTWKEKLKTDQHVLLSTDGKLPHPRELSLIKEETLLIVLPGHGEVTVPARPPAPALNFEFRHDTSPNGTQYFRSVPRDPTQYFRSVPLD